MKFARLPIVVLCALALISCSTSSIRFDSPSGLQVRGDSTDRTETTPFVYDMSCGTGTPGPVVFLLALTVVGLLFLPFMPRRGGSDDVEFVFDRDTLQQMGFSQVEIAEVMKTGNRLRGEIISNKCPARGSVQLTEAQVRKALLSGSDIIYQWREASGELAFELKLYPTL